MTVMVDGKTAQREAALSRANEIRFGNAALKRRLRAMDRPTALRELASLLEDPPQTLLSPKIGRVLRFAPRLGRTLVAEGLAQAGLRSEDRRVGELSERQRRVLADWLRHRADMNEWSRWKDRNRTRG